MIGAESLVFVSVEIGVARCVTQGRIVDEARRRILEAMKLFVDDARLAEIVTSGLSMLVLPVRRLLRRVPALREPGLVRCGTARRSARRAQA